MIHFLKKIFFILTMCIGKYVHFQRASPHMQRSKKRPRFQDISRIRRRATPKKFFHPCPSPPFPHKPVVISFFLKNILHIVKFLTVIFWLICCEIEWTTPSPTPSTNRHTCLGGNVTVSDHPFRSNSKAS